MKWLLVLCGIFWLSDLALAELPDRQQFARKDGWLYIQGDDSSCGKNAREDTERYLNELRTISYDLDQETMQVNSGKEFEAERRGDSVTGYVQVDGGEKDGVSYFKVMVFMLFENEDGQPMIMFMRLFRLGEFQCSDSFGTGLVLDSV